MSKNSIYTFDYFQPNEYRFSLDSVFLAQRVAKHIENRPNLSELRFLDLCSGCGVIGLEMSIHLPQISNFDFVEVQDVYREYFLKNLDGIHPENDSKHFNFILGNYNLYTDDKTSNLYDYIVSNPPYFFKEEGMHSPSEFKNRCRFFLDSDFKTLIDSITNMLKPNGEAFLLVRPGSHHGRDLFSEIKMHLKGSLNTCDLFDEVRGTNIIRIIKKV